MKEVDANKLREIIESEVTSDTEQMFYKDAFAAGCYLHTKKGVTRQRASYATACLSRLGTARGRRTSLRCLVT